MKKIVIKGNRRKSLTRDIIHYELIQNPRRHDGGHSRKLLDIKKGRRREKHKEKFI